jgi:DNA-directed RNA polymerase sigma subunit (sigma70/sigma32)
MIEKVALVQRDVQKQEMSLWKEWKDTNNPRVLGHLMTSIQPIIQTTVNKFSAVPIPSSAIEGEAKKQAISAFRTYNPRAGAALGTHVNNYMKKVNRFVYEHQNVGRIPEHRIIQIGTYQGVKSELNDKLGRSPSAVELSDELSWSLPEVERMERELKTEVPESAVADVDFTFSAQTEAQKILNYIYYELAPQEKVIFEHLTGWAGKPQISDQEISSKLRISPDRMKKLKSSITRKIAARMP